MPHYPDEIEYSDKYVDDYYEYRHVLLPKEVYKKIPRNRLLTESVPHSSCRSGAHLESSNPADGHTTSCIVLNHTSCSSAEPRTQIPRLASPLPDSCPHLTLSVTDLHHMPCIHYIKGLFSITGMNHLSSKLAFCRSALTI